MGDKVKAQDDTAFTIQEVIEQKGLLIYTGENQRLPEADLSDLHQLAGTQDRLFAGRFDVSRTFELRHHTLELHHRSRKSPLRGFIVAALIDSAARPYIAQDVANRHAPHMMLMRNGDVPDRIFKVDRGISTNSEPHRIPRHRETVAKLDSPDAFAAVIAKNCIPFCFGNVTDRFVPTTVVNTGHCATGMLTSLEE